jgi:hypothetical protein
MLFSDFKDAKTSQSPIIEEKSTLGHLKKEIIQKTSYKECKHLLLHPMIHILQSKLLKVSIPSEE